MGNAFRSVMGMGTIYGFDIAVEEAFRNILIHSDMNEFYCMYEPNQYQEMIIKRKIRAAKRPEVKYHMISEYDALWKNEVIDIDILHSVSMDFLPLFHYRDKFVKRVPPITYTIHGVSYPNYINDFYIMQLFAPVKEYDSIICTSNSVKKVISNMHEKISEELYEKKKIKVEYNGRLDVIPLGIDVERFKPSDKNEMRIKLGIPLDSFVILWLGRLSAYDKADLYPLFIVLKRLLAHNIGKKIHLVIAGHDREGAPHLEALKQYAGELGVNEQVIFMQDYDVKNRNEIFSCADLFTSPVDNIQETFGITPLEAMACGIPQIVSDFDGYKDTVVDGETGFKISTVWAKCDDDINRAGMLPCDAEHRLFLHHFLTAQSIVLDLEEYEAKIQMLMDYPDLKEKMGKASRQRAKELYDWRNIIKKYDELWRELHNISIYSNGEKKSNEMIYMEPSYYRSFLPYVSKSIDNDIMLYITEEGKDICCGRIKYIVHYEYEKYLQETKIAFELLEHIYSQGGNSKMKLLADYFEQYSENIIKRGIMKLLKQGFISFKNKSC